MQSTSQPFKLIRQFQFQSKTLKSDKLDSINDASSRESPQIKYSSENELKSEQSYFFSGSDCEDSCVSLEQNQILQHNSCVQEKVQKLFNYLFIQTPFSSRFQTENFKEINNQYSLIQYLKNGESLISKEDLPHFLSYLKTHSKLKEFLDNVFDKVSPLLAPQLILITKQITVQYQSIKYQKLQMNQLLALASNQLFLKKVFANSSLQFLNYKNTVFHFYWYEVIMNTLISQFFVFFTFTVLLVLQEFFINPYYTQIKVETSTTQKLKNNDKENHQEIENEIDQDSYFYTKSKKIKKTHHSK